jgi:hypothetical protein
VKMSGSKEKESSERENLANELAELKAEVRALRRERDEASCAMKLAEQVTMLRKNISDLEISKAKLVEDNDRKIRETEHKVGLLKLQQQHEVSNAKRETTLEVREGNLSADKERFAAEMEFQRKQLQGEVERIDGILGKILERLPNINASLSGRISAPKERAEV